MADRLLHKATQHTRGSSLSIDLICTAKNSRGQVLYTSSSQAQPWNIGVWDPRTGTSLCTYAGESSAPHTLALVGNSYVISAVTNKTLVHVWLLQKREAIHQRLVLPGRVTALTVSPDGLYCVAAAQQLIHVWQLSTGNLLAVLEKHYQNVTCIRFSDDGSHFVSAGADNLVMAWSFSQVLSSTSSSYEHSVEPRHIWSDHSLPVSDVHVSAGAVRARVYTASHDHSCKVYELCSGQLLRSIVFECALTSLLVDSTETRMFAGAKNGNIYQVNLYTHPVKTEHHVTEDNQSEPLVFQGHKKAVSCLTLSLDGCLLVSGSQDAQVRVWHVISHQCIRTLPHQAPVTNVLLSTVRPVLQPAGTANLQPLQAFKRYLHNTQESTDQHGADSGSVPVFIDSTAQPESTDDTDDVDDDVMSYIKRISRAQQATSSSDDVTQSLEVKVDKLKAINKQLFDYALENIMDVGDE